MATLFKNYEICKTTHLDIGFVHGSSDRLDGRRGFAVGDEDQHAVTAGRLVGEVLQHLLERQIRTGAAPDVVLTRHDGVQRVERIPIIVCVEMEVLEHVSVVGDETNTCLVGTDVEVVDDVAHRLFRGRQFFGADTLRCVHHKVHVHHDILAS